MKGQDSNVYSIQKSVETQLKKPESKKQILMFEYKILLLYASQYGIYLVPQLENIQGISHPNLVWHGIVFIRNGLYKEGKFKFKADFKSFPQQPPQISFMSEVYHPLVNIETGQLDLNILLDGKWSYGSQNMLFQVFQKMKSIFTDVKKLETPNSFNNGAYELFKSNLQQFYIKVLSCIEKSNKTVYQNYQNSSLRFSQPNAQHSKISEELSNICQKPNLSLDQKKKMFLKFILQ